MLLFQSLLLALPAMASNSVGLYHVLLCLMQRPFPPAADHTQTIADKPLPPHTLHTDNITDKPYIRTHYTQTTSQTNLIFLHITHIKHHRQTLYPYTLHTYNITDKPYIFTLYIHTTSQTNLISVHFTYIQHHRQSLYPDTSHTDNLWKCEKSLHTVIQHWLPPGGRSHAMSLTSPASPLPWVSMQWSFIHDIHSSD